jgi:hypothetical protein
MIFRCIIYLITLINLNAQSSVDYSNFDPLTYQKEYALWEKEFSVKKSLMIITKLEKKGDETKPNNEIYWQL